MSNGIYSWIKSGLIDSKSVQDSLELVGERPGSVSWFNFIKQTLVLLALLSLAVGVVFFFAYNWNDMGRQLKFLILQVLLVGTFLLYFFKPLSAWVGQAVLMAGVLVLGALLALFGQTYQTGADPWQLFATWAMLISPLVLFSRSEGLWVFFALLLNTALGLYIQVHGSLFGMLFNGHYWLWVFLLLNASLLILLENISGDSIKSLNKIKLNNRWAAQVLALSVFYILAVMGMEAIFGGNHELGLNLLLFILGMAGSFAYYRYVEKDLLLLTAWALSMIFFILGLLANTVFEGFDAGGLLLMAISLIGMSTWAVAWLKKTHETFKQEKSA